MIVFEAYLLDFGEGEVPDHVDIDPEWVDSYAPDTFRVVSAKDHEDDGFEFACDVPDMETAVLIGEAWYRKRPYDTDPVWIIDGQGNKAMLHPPEVPTDASIFDALGSEVEQRMAKTARHLDTIEGVTFNDLAGVPPKKL